jgi:hypothetical protein
MRTKTNRLEELFVRLTGSKEAMEVRMSHPNLVALATITRREVTRILRIWGQTLVPPAITMTLYFLIFGNLIGSAHR